MSVELLLPAFLFALTMLSGYRLAHLGRPFGAGIFTLHKLLALASTVLGIYQGSKRLSPQNAQPVVGGLLVVAILTLFALFVSGALISSLKNIKTSFILIHRIAPFLLIVAIFIFFLLLF